MRVRGLRWVGVLNGSGADMRAFATEVLGLRPLQDTPTLLETVAGNGDRFELFEPSSSRETWEFNPNSTMVGFLVDDLTAARAELAAAEGVELLGDLTVQPDGYGWQYFRAPDANVYVLVADPSA